ncbi:MAG: hypothetical protein A4E54_01439 [Pelotomaculum sp. PtaB.Bin117]|nr:MAG: hypothetical protein A4E54_01439 [Pelotomaculum sp. PtaB.Bin117]OPY59941.1 MAG: hypothetical protein A4E56_03000 [Pelotomaculum sp. PtaU1.Bin065]
MVYVLYYSALKINHYHFQLFDGEAKLHGSLTTEF